VASLIGGPVVMIVSWVGRRRSALDESKMHLPPLRKLRIIWPHHSNDQQWTLQGHAVFARIVGYGAFHPVADRSGPRPAILGDSPPDCRALVLEEH